LVRLFGLRSELIPFIEPDVVDLIDKRLAPLYIIENGSYTFRADKLSEFADVAVSAKTLVAFVEDKLTQKYRAQSK
jgi:hypothetical protein